MPEATEDALQKALREANENLKNLPPPEKSKDEVNFDDISSDSSEEEEPAQNNAAKSDTESAASEEKFSVDERLTRAESSKLSGNDFFKKADNREALSFYNKGLQVLEPIEDERDLPKDYKKTYHDLRISLLLNKSAVCNRLTRYEDSITSCTKVIAKTQFKTDYQSSYLKALLRRGVAHVATGSLKDGKNDLLAIIKIDASNRDALRELRKLKSLIAEENKRAKQTFGNIFKKSVNIYDDKEAEMKRRAAELKKKEDKLKQDYEEEKIMSDNSDEFMSFEEWKKVKEDEKKKEEEQKEKEKKEKEREKEEKRRKKSEEERKKKIANGEDPDAVQLDEEDLAAIADVKKKGYCHFRREKTADEIEMLKNNGPSKLEASEENQDLSHQPSGDSEHSAWNNARTWEERDVTEKVKAELENELKTIRFAQETSKGIKAELYVDKVNSVNGDCQVVFVSSKTGTVYDINLELKFKCVIESDENEHKFSGKLKFVEIANGMKNEEYEQERSFSTGKLEKLSPDETAALQQCFARFDERIRQKIYFIVEEQFSSK